MSVRAFDFATTRRIVFGLGRADELGSFASQHGSRAFVCTGGDPDRHRDVLGGVTVPFRPFSVEGEPTVEMARRATSLAVDFRADLVIGIGGGSVIDLAKAVAMLVGNGGDAMDYLEVIGLGRPIEQPSLSMIAVPTTAGTGAEVTSNAVLASPEHSRKASLRSQSMLPSLAIVDPVLTVSCPPDVTASSGLDAVIQCLEPFVSINANPMTDAFAREGLARASVGLRRSYSDGADLVARTEMALCSLLGGLCLANSKLGAVHGLAGVIGGTVEIPHGVACASVLVATVRANVRALRERQPDSPALGRYRQAAEILTGRGSASIEGGTEWLAETVDMLGIKRLADYGLRPEQADDVAAKAARASSTRGNPVELTLDELKGVVSESM